MKTKRTIYDPPISCHCESAYGNPRAEESADSNRPPYRLRDLGLW